MDRHCQRAGCNQQALNLRSFCSEHGCIRRTCDEPKYDGHVTCEQHFLQAAEEAKAAREKQPREPFLSYETERAKNNAKYNGCQVCGDWNWYSDTRMTCWKCERNGYCTAPHCREKSCQKHAPPAVCIIDGCKEPGVHERDAGWRCERHQYSLTTKDPIGSVVDILRFAIGIPLGRVMALFKERDPLTGMTMEQIRHERWEEEQRRLEET